MLHDSSDKNIDFYIIYAREGTWNFGLRHVNTSSDSLKQQTIMSISLEGCPKQCSSHGDCKYSFDATGLTSYRFMLSPFGSSQYILVLFYFLFSSNYENCVK